MDKENSSGLEIICNEKVKNALKAAWVALDNKDLQDRIRDESRHQEVLDEYELPQVALNGLLEIVHKMDFFIKKPSTTNIDNNSRKSERSDEEDKKDLYEPFRHIRWSFFISMGMSLIVFALGILFLAIALKRYLIEGSLSTSTLTIAGLGTADFVLIFYSRPWRDISINLSTSQKMRMIATTYLAGMSLIKSGEMDRFEALQKLTKSSVSLVDEVANAEHGQGETARNEAE